MWSVLFLCCPSWVRAWLLCACALQHPASSALSLGGAALCVGTTAILQSHTVFRRRSPVCAHSTVGGCSITLLYPLDQFPGGGASCSCWIQFQAAWLATWYRGLADQPENWIELAPLSRCKGNVNNGSPFPPAWIVPFSSQRALWFPSLLYAFSLCCLLYRSC